MKQETITTEQVMEMIENENAAEAYGIVTGRIEWGQDMDRLIPKYMHGGLVRWVLFGIPPGSFQQAVIRGDLFEAVRKADDVNAGCLQNYVRFFYNSSPGGCFGTGAKTWKGILPQE